MKNLSFIALFALALMLSACGGGNDIVTDPGTTPVVTNPVATDKTPTPVPTTAPVSTTMTRDQIYLKVSNEEFAAVTGTFQEFMYRDCDYGGGTDSYLGGWITISTSTSSVDCTYDSVAAFADDEAGMAAKKAELLGYVNSAYSIMSSGNTVQLYINVNYITKVIKIDFSKALLAQPVEEIDYSDRTTRYLIQ